MWSDPAEQLRQVAVEVRLEVDEARWCGRRNHCRQSTGQPPTQLRKVEPNKSDRRGVVEDGQKDVRASHRRKLAKKDLPFLTGVVEGRERIAVELTPDFGRRRMNRRCECAGGHHVDGSREAMLGEHATAGLEQQREPNAGIVDELEERFLDPWLDRGSHSARLT